MKNRVSNYLTKVAHNQIKSVTDRKDFAENVLLCEKSMNELKEIYWHEKELLIAIPMLISNATTFELVEVLTVHLIYLRKHLKELERKFPFINQLETNKNNPKNNQMNRIAIP
jgi:ferritin-like metal-binding protein YciE